MAPSALPPWLRAQVDDLAASPLPNGTLLVGSEGPALEAMARELALRHLGLSGAEPASTESTDLGPAGSGLAGGEDGEQDAPDLLEVRAGAREQGKGGRQAIGVDDVRRLGEFLQVHAAGGRGRVAVLHYAGEMTPAASNALLKVLEEPPPQAALILTAVPSQRLPATVLSRVRRHRLRRCSMEEALDWMRGRGLEVEAGDDWRPLLWRLSCSQPERFEQLAAGGGAAMAEDVCGQLAGICEGAVTPHAVAEGWAADRPLERLELCYLILADVLRERHGGALDPWPAASSRARLAQALRGLSAAAASELAESLALALSRCGSRQVGAAVLAGEWIREGGAQRLDWALREFLEALPAKLRAARAGR